MTVLVDSGVWSLALRRRQISQDPKALELRELIREGRAHVIGPIRQEVLSGIGRPEETTAEDVGEG